MHTYSTIYFTVCCYLTIFQATNREYKWDMVHLNWFWFNHVRPLDRNLAHSTLRSAGNWLNFAKYWMQQTRSCSLGNETRKSGKISNWSSTFQKKIPALSPKIDKRRMPICSATDKFKFSALALTVGFQKRRPNFVSWSQTWKSFPLVRRTENLLNFRAWAGLVHWRRSTYWKGPENSASNFQFSPGQK